MRTRLYSLRNSSYEDTSAVNIPLAVSRPESPALVTILSRSRSMTIASLLSFSSCLICDLISLRLDVISDILCLNTAMLSFGLSSLVRSNVPYFSSYTLRACSMLPSILFLEADCASISESLAAALRSESLISRRRFSIYASSRITSSPFSRFSLASSSDIPLRFMLLSDLSIAARQLFISLVLSSISPLRPVISSCKAANLASTASSSIPSGLAASSFSR